MEKKLFSLIISKIEAILGKDAAEFDTTTFLDIIENHKSTDIKYGISVMGVPEGMDDSQVEIDDDYYATSNILEAVKKIISITALDIIKHFEKKGCKNCTQNLIASLIAYTNNFETSSILYSKEFDQIDTSISEELLELADLTSERHLFEGPSVDSDAFEIEKEEDQKVIDYLNKVVAPYYGQFNDFAYFMAKRKKPRAMGGPTWQIIINAYKGDYEAEDCDFKDAAWQVYKNDKDIIKLVDEALTITLEDVFTFLESKGFKNYKNNPTVRIFCPDIKDDIIFDLLYKQTEKNDMYTM